MDASYGTSHFKDALGWIFTKTPGKTIRIVQSLDQMLRSHHKVDDPADPETDPKKKKKIDQVGPPNWPKHFSETALAAAAKEHGMTTTELVKYSKKVANPEDRGNKTGVVQHTQVINAKNEVQCDILVLQSDLGHHEIRDNVMDDAINSIGKGAAGADEFGKAQMPDYGRDSSLPHHGNEEPKPPPKEKPKQKPKPK
jgi:hypothetical protein